MRLDERITKNSEYFRGMEITENTLIVRVSYPSKWGVYSSEDNKVKVTKSDDTPNLWFYYGNYMEITIDEVFDLIENTIETNMNAQAKLDLLTLKFEELKALFSKESLERLKTLEFKLYDEINTDTPKTKRKYNRKPKNTIVEHSICEGTCDNASTENTEHNIEENKEEQ